MVWRCEVYIVVWCGMQCCWLVKSIVKMCAVLVHDEGYCGVAWCFLLPITFPSHLISHPINFHFNSFVIFQIVQFSVDVILGLLQVKKLTIKRSQQVGVKPLAKIRLL